MTDTPRTDAGRRMLSAIADHADLLRHDPANGLPLGLSYILAIEADAASVRVGDDGLRAAAQAVVDAVPLPLRIASDGQPFIDTLTAKSPAILALRAALAASPAPTLDHPNDEYPFVAGVNVVEPKP